MLKKSGKIQQKVAVEWKERWQNKITKRADNIGWSNKMLKMSGTMKQEVVVKWGEKRGDKIRWQKGVAIGVMKWGVE